MERPHLVLFLVAGVLVAVSVLVLQVLGGSGLGVAIPLWAVAIGLIAVGLWRRRADKR